MKSFYPVIFFVVFFGIVLSTGVTAQFQRSYGTQSAEYGLALDFTRFDKGYIQAGFTAETFFGGGDATMIKTDDAGNQLWAGVYGGERQDLFHAVRHQEPGQELPAYVATGYTNSFGFGSSDVYLVGTDINGVPLFSSVFGGENRETGHCIQPIKDPEIGQGLVIVGETLSFPKLFPGNNVYVIKTDAFGNLVQSVVIGNEGDQRGYWIEQTKDGGFIIAGSTTLNCTFDPTSRGREDILIIRLNPDLSIAWERTFGSFEFNDSDIAYSIIENPDGSFTATGVTRSFGINNSPDAFLLNIDAGGGFNWLRTYGLENIEAGISLKSHIDADGSFYYTVLGYRYDPTTGTNYDAYMFQTDGRGNLLWTRTYGLEGTEFGYELTKNVDPGFAFTGYTTSLGVGGPDFYLVETNLAGRSFTVCERRIKQEEIRHEPCITEELRFDYVEQWEPISSFHERIEYGEERCPTIGTAPTGNQTPENEGIKVFPNPGQDVLNLTLSEKQTNGEVVLLQAATNKMVLKSTITNTENITMSIKDIPKGMYIIQVTTDDGKVLQKRFFKDED